MDAATEDMHAGSDSNVGKDCDGQLLAGPNSIIDLQARIDDQEKLVARLTAKNEDLERKLQHARNEIKPFATVVQRMERERVEAIGKFDKTDQHL